MLVSDNHEPAQLLDPNTAAAWSQNPCSVTVIPRQLRKVRFGLVRVATRNRRGFHSYPRLPFWHVYLTWPSPESAAARHRSWCPPVPPPPPPLFWAPLYFPQNTSTWAPHVSILLSLAVCLNHLSATAFSNAWGIETLF